MPFELDDLHFDSLIRGYVEANARFVRRDWLAVQVDEELREPEKRFVLLTAEPGAGKSVFMAQLAHDHPEWLRYFIRRDQREVLADVSARSLLLRVGYQLAARHAELFSKDQLTLSVKQRLGEVAEQGEAVGVEVGRLIASPFYRMVLEIEQQVQVNRGKVVGLRAKELYVEERLLPAEDLLHLALIDPALALQRADPKRQLVILIDALDETRYHPSTDNILVWLTNCPQLPENIRFVLSSRPPDETLRLFCDKQTSRFGELTIAEDDPHVEGDIAQFVTRLIGEAALADALAASPGGTAAFAVKANAKAHGNLGYLDALARGLDQALAQTHAAEEPIRLRGRGTLDALLNLKELPADLGGLYAFFLHQIKVGVADQQIVGKDSSGKTFSTDVWPAVYEPVLGVLAVAAEPLEAELIAKHGDIAVDLKWVRPALNRLRQFLDVVDGRYRYYHATVAEFLTTKKTDENPDTHDLYQDARQWHEHIIAYYRAKAGSWATVDWNNVDAYGLLHLAAHLYALSSDVTYRRQLYEFVSRPVVFAKWQRFGSLESLVGDLRIAMNAAVQEKPLNWIDFMRCYLLERTLDSFELSTDVLSFIASSAAQSGQLKDARKIIDQALEVASHIEASAEKARTLSTIAAFLFNAGAKGDAQEVVDRALAETKLIENVQEKSEALSALVLNMARVHDLERTKDVVRQALAIAQSNDFSWARAISFSSIARALSQVGEQGLAKEASSQALKAAWNVKDNDDRAYALCAVAAAMEQAGDKDAEYVFRDAGSQLYGFGMPPEEIEDEFNSIYVDYRAKSGDPETLFGLALGIRDRSQQGTALYRLAERLAKMVLFGNYPRESGGELDIDRLCDRATFFGIASEEADSSVVRERKFTLRGLCQATLGVEVV